MACLGPKIPLGGRIFSGMAPVSDDAEQRDPQTPLASRGQMHHRPEYPSLGCVPAEPDSVSPGTFGVPILGHACKSYKVHRAPERCLENPGGSGAGRPLAHEVTHRFRGGARFSIAPHSSRYSNMYNVPQNGQYCAEIDRRG